MKRKWFELLCMVLLSVAGPTTAGAFSQADLNRLLSGDRNMRNADLSGITNMQLAAQTQMSLQNYDFTGADFSASNLISLDLSHSTLEGAKFDNASLHAMHFNQAKFTAASLRGADLQNAQGEAADLSNANLSGAKMTSAFFNSCLFLKADLSGANLSDSRFYAADFSGARLTGATLANADLSQAKIDVAWKSFIQSQNVRNFEHIMWVKPAPVDPKSVQASPGAGKMGKQMVKPKVLPKKEDIPAAK